MVTEYQTLKSPAEGLYREKGSKFLAYAWPVADEGDIRKRMEETRALHPKARHVCSAWRLGVEEISEYAGDAGEPAGSAGLPMLNALRSLGLTNTLVVVVRYFGGTKLGIPGLIHAYREAASDALQRAGRETREVVEIVNLEMPYESADAVYRQADRCGARIVEYATGQSCRFTVEVPVREAAAFRNALKAWIVESPTSPPPQK